MNNMIIKNRLFVLDYLAGDEHRYEAIRANAPAKAGTLQILDKLIEFVCKKYGFEEEDIEPVILTEVFADMTEKELSEAYKTEKIGRLPNQILLINYNKLERLEKKNDSR